MILYLSIQQIEALHASQVEEYGGATGLRDRGGLEAAVARPAMTFGGEDLYPDLASKSAALMHSLVMNHPFVDGNKRVGVQAALVFLLVNGSEVEASSEELVEITLAVARGEIDAERLAIWFRQRISGESYLAEYADYPALGRLQHKDDPIVSSGVSRRRVARRKR